jgi:hypothetical protein
MFTLPEGMMTLADVTPRITSSGAGGGMNRQRQQRRVLDRLRLDALDAVHVEEVVLVVVGEVAFHLRGAHPAVRLRDVDHRKVEIGKDIDARAADGKRRRQRDGDDGHQQRDGTTMGSADKPHID